MTFKEQDDFFVPALENSFRILYIRSSGVEVKTIGMANGLFQATSTRIIEINRLFDREMDKNEQRTTFLFHSTMFASNTEKLSTMIE